MTVKLKHCYVVLRDAERSKVDAEEKNLAIDTMTGYAILPIELLLEISAQGLSAAPIERLEGLLRAAKESKP